MEGVIKTSADWEASIWSKFEELIETAKLCRADVVVLASLADAYPDGWEERAAALGGHSMTILLLTRTDLDAGYRRLPKLGAMPERPMFIRELVPDRNEMTLRREPPGGRTMDAGGGLVAHFG